MRSCMNTSFVIRSQNFRAPGGTISPSKEDTAMFLGFGKKEENYENKTLKVSLTRCPQSHACPSVRVCPVGALSQNGYHAPVVDQKKCIRCGKCTGFCPMHALRFE